MKFSDKVAVITGAGGRMGTAIAAKFLQEGALLVLVDLTSEIAQHTADSIGIPSGNCICLGADVADEESVKSIVNTILNRFGHIDALVNLAGISGPSARTEDYTFEDAKKVFSVNVFGTFLMMKNVLPVMQDQHSGAIINFGSVSGMFGYPYEIAYGASKAAVIFMTKNAANENGGNGVRINSISPGWVNTAMMKSILESYKDVGIKDSYDNVTLGPMNRPAEPEEIANVVFFMCSSEASYVNGSNWLVDGGMTLG